MDNPLVSKAREFFRRHWRRALQLREKFELREEAFHLVLAGGVGVIGGGGGVGVIGGFVNVVFFHLIEQLKLFFYKLPSDPVEIAEMMPQWERALIPTLGGLAAGLVLYWGLRLVPRRGPNNLLEVIVAGDGRLPFRSGLVHAAS